MRKVKRNDIHEYEFDYKNSTEFPFNNSINIFFQVIR